MDDSVLESSALFSGVPVAEIRGALESTPHYIQCYDKGEIIFHLMENAAKLGIILEGSAEAQKSFPNGSQVNVSVRKPGEMIGPAAVFSRSRKYPCDVVSLEPVTVMMFRREDLLKLMQSNARILENFLQELASATYMLQQRLELLSYNGIAQKAAFWLLMQIRQTEKTKVAVPESMTKWAMMMNVSRPSLHREMKALEQRGIIGISGHMIEIKDTDALQNVLSE